MIDTREELTQALTEAAEIEHGLMIQYLFPALSLKKRLTEGLSGHQQSLVREWEGVILRVAVEEMGHLGTVCNLLSAIGEGPASVTRSSRKALLRWPRSSPASRPT